MKLIAIEGPDKVGKATQTKLLVDALNYDAGQPDASSRVVRVEIPFNDGNTYDKLYAMLKDGSALEYPQAFQTFQAANRMNWQKYELPKLNSYDYVVLDRWNISAWVYGRAAGLTDSFLTCVLDRVVKADLVFVLDGKPMGEPTDSYEADKGFMTIVRQEYRRWAQENPDVAILIDPNRPRDEVHKDILEHFKRSI